MACPAHALAVQGVQLTAHGRQTWVTLQFDQADLSSTAFKPSGTVEGDPWRLSVDLPPFDWQAGTIHRPDSILVTDVRQGAVSAGMSRIVFGLRGPALVKSAGFDGGPGQYVIKLAPTTAARAQAMENTEFGGPTSKSVTPAATGSAKNGADDVAADIAAETPDSADQTPAAPPAMKTKILKNGNQNAAQVRAVVLPPDSPQAAPAGPPLIVIDPGHGGIDPGTHGPDTIVEKDVTLANARALRDALVATGRYRVLLTRDDDTYLYLPQRVAFARAHHADMFISLHADSSPVNDATRGASVYTLSETASDAETAKLAANENRADQIAGVDLHGQDEDVAGILVDLAMRQTMNQSNFLASTVVSDLHVGGVPLLAEKPHRSAGFAVLKDPDVPSILVEMGFLSNPRQAQALTDPAFQAQLAASLTAAVDGYFSKIRGADRP